MATGRSTIPLHRLEETTDEGFQLKRLPSQDYIPTKAIFLDAHRDDHYLFFLQEKGRRKVMVDFHTFNLKDNTVFFMLPGQVHQYVFRNKVLAGWFIAIDTGLIPDEFRTVLEDPLLDIRPINPGAPCIEQMGRCLELACDLDQQPASSYYKRAVYS